MARFIANGKLLEADLFVFDKDGLMFDSSQFWNELTNSRCRYLLPVCGLELTLEWAHMMGADTVADEADGFATTYVDPLGILAVASPFEERSVLGGYLVKKLGMPWHEARAKAIEVFEAGDQNLDLHRAIKAQPGYVALMQGLISKDIPYGVATSDTLKRTQDSMAIYSCWDKVRFVVTPDDVAEGKPSPDMLYLIAKNTGVSLERMAMVGDSYVDVKMAHAAGAIGIGVSANPEMCEKMKPYATVILSSLEEITLLE